MLITNLIFQDKQRIDEQLKGNYYVFPGGKSLLQLYSNYQRLFVLPPSLILTVNLNETLSKTIQKLSWGQIHPRFDLELFNLTASKTLKVNLNIVVKQIVPDIDEAFGIKSYELTQSQHEPELITYQGLLKVGKNFLSVKILLEFGTVKFQRQKGGKSTSVSIVFTKFNQDFFDFFYFFSEMAMIAPNAKIFFAQLIELASKHPAIAKCTQKETKVKLKKVVGKELDKYGLTITRSNEIRLLNSEGGNKFCALLTELFKCAIKVEPISGTFLNGEQCENQYECQQKEKHRLLIKDGAAAIVLEKEHVVQVEECFSDSDNSDNENESETKPTTTVNDDLFENLMNPNISNSDCEDFIKKIEQVRTFLSCVI